LNNEFLLLYFYKIYFKAEAETIESISSDFYEITSDEYDLLSPNSLEFNIANDNEVLKSGSDTSHSESDYDTDVDFMSRILLEEEDFQESSDHPRKYYSAIFLRNFYLKLWNDGNSCYCNSLVQAILSLNHRALSRVIL